LSTIILVIALIFLMNYGGNNNKDIEENLNLEYNIQKIDKYIKFNGRSTVKRKE